MKNTSGPVMVNFELSGENRDIVNAAEGSTIGRRINKIISDYAKIRPKEDNEREEVSEESTPVDVKIDNILKGGKVAYLPWYEFDDISYAENILSIYNEKSVNKWTVEPDGEGFWRFKPNS